MPEQSQAQSTPETPKPSASAPPPSSSFTRPAKTDPREGIPAQAEGKPAVETKPATSAPAENKEDFLKPRFEELAKQQKRVALERRALAEEKAGREKEKTEFEEWRQERLGLKRNPTKFLSREFGENWYDTLTKYRAEGVPPGDLVLAEVDSAKSELLKKLEEREAALNKRLEDFEARQAMDVRQQAESNLVEMVKASDKYPLTNLFAEHKSVLVEMERSYLAGCTRDADGNITGPGNWDRDAALHVAAQTVESRIQDIGSKVQEAEKKRTAKPQGSTAAPVVPAEQREVAPAQRRTLSTEMTSNSASEWTPPKDDAERMKRAIARFDAVQAARQQQH